MHSLLKHKMPQLTLKISLYMAPTCFGPFGPSSGSIRRKLAKVTVFVELLVKYIVKIVAVLWQYVLQSVMYVLGAVRRTAPSTHTAVQTEAHIATAQRNFNAVFLLIISTKTVTLARFRRMLPDDGPNGPKHVGAT
jgi:hypothetical protein